MRQFRHYLSPPVFEDEDKTRAAELLNALLLISLFGALLNLVFLLVFAQGETGGLAFTLLAILLVLGVWVLMHRGNVRLGGVILLSLAWINLTAAAISSGFGLRETNLGGFLIIMLAAGMILGWQGAIGFMGLGILGSLGLLILEQNKLLIPPVGGQVLINIWLEQTIYFIAGAIVLGLSLRRTDQATARARREVAERREAELLYQTLVEQIPAITYNDIADERSHSVYVSPQVHAMLGFTPEEWQEGDLEFWLGQIHPAERQRAREAYLLTMTTGEPFDMEYRILARDGRELWVHDRASALSDETGKPSMVHGVIFDITASKTAAKELDRQRDFALQVMSAMGQGLTVTGPDNHYEYVNLAFARMTGNPREMMLGKMPVDFMLPQDQADLLEGQTSSWLGGTTTYEARLRHAEGGLVDVLVTSAPRLEEGEVSGSIAVITDLTERKQTEQALQRSLARLEILHNIETAVRQVMQSPESIAEAAVEGLRNLVDCRRVSVSLFDFQAQQVLLLAVSSLKPSPIAVGSRMALASFGLYIVESLRDGQVHMIRNVEAVDSISDTDLLLLREGVQAWLYVPMFYQGSLIGSLNLGDSGLDKFTHDTIDTARDVANLMAIAIQQSRLFEEIQRLNLDLELRVALRTAELEAANREMEAFTYTVSHDLRAPLRAIDGYSRIISEDYTDKLGGESEICLKHIRSSTQRMGALIDDLLSFSRLGRRLPALDAVSSDELRSLVLGLSHELDAEPRPHPVELAVGALSPCRADRSLLRQVFLNLLSNAYKFTRHRDPALVEVGSQATENGQAYFIRDNGAGFDMRYVDNMFGVFQRLHTDEEFEGTGVGLAIVQRIVQKHGGRVWAEGKVGGGATFYFTLA